MDTGYLSVLSIVVLTMTLLFCSRTHAHVANQVTTLPPPTTTASPEIQSATAAVRTLESKQALALLANFLVARLTNHLQPRQTTTNAVSQQEAAVYYPPSYNYGYYGYNGQPNTNGHNHNGNGYNAYYPNGYGYSNYAVNGNGNSGYGNGYYPPQPVDQTPLDPESNDELERTMAAFNSIEDSSARGTRFNPFPVISQPKQFGQFQGAMGQNKLSQRQMVMVPGTPITGSYGYAVSSGGSSYG